MYADMKSSNQKKEKSISNLYIRNTVENDFKKMKQYYGNENYIKLFVEERLCVCERERSGLKIFLSDMSDHI